MQKIQSLRYTANLSEEIDIAVTPTGTAAFVAASLDGHTLSPLPNTDNAPEYKFLINRPVGKTHFVAMEFSFPQAAAGAKYDVSVSGSNGGSDTFKVSATDAVKDVILRFKVTP
jgi:hypothetical protein